jgi:hypothetical protein
MLTPWLHRLLLPAPRPSSRARTDRCVDAPSLQNAWRRCGSGDLRGARCCRHRARAAHRLAQRWPARGALREDDLRGVQRATFLVRGSERRRRARRRTSRGGGSPGCRRLIGCVSVRGTDDRHAVVAASRRERPRSARCAHRRSSSAQKKIRTGALHAWARPCQTCGQARAGSNGVNGRGRPSRVTRQPRALRRRSRQLRSSCGSVRRRSLDPSRIRCPHQSP